MNGPVKALERAAPKPAARPRPTVGAAIERLLREAGVTAAFGVISIHNMPILDAIGEAGAIRFVPARGEAGALNMADACARVSGRLGVALTSTGTACGNAAGAMVEALTAGTPLLHLTGQIETPYLDRNLAYIHEAPDQLSMIKANSKAAYRVRHAAEAVGIVKAAILQALSAPAGPVTVEIPIDIQAETIEAPEDWSLPPVRPVAPDPAGLDALAEALSRARRPLIWAGGGARHAGAALARLLDMGFGLVTSTQGRGVVPEGDPRSLGAFNLQPAVEAFYESCDALVAVGTRLRGNETLKYALGLPRPLYRVDADAGADGRGYPNARFVQGDSALVLAGLADRLAGRLAPDPAFHGDLAAARARAEAALRGNLGPYAGLVDALRDTVDDDFLWVRDVTISNSTWGNRLMRLVHPRNGVHALGGGIGQGLPMGIGAALAGTGKKAVVLSGDGGLQLCLGELATAAQEGADLTLMIMNSRGYGVIRNIQDAAYGGRRRYVDLLTPDYEKLCASMSLPYARVADIAQARAALGAAYAKDGPAVVEIDMDAIGDFAQAFAGPPARKDTV